ncbi:hypothetical protein [Pseudomonas guariconensis]|uniref:hypothetical protein n=1 Tax=Pseudomonas guariconensis TaxID=1288410 RepID=UPI0018AB77F8|nr:hypothetical protein [Pseudomonas guariconensis]MBF8720182.1 hypothetical protein [Pseudomonas guariconensis]
MFQRYLAAIYEDCGRELPRVDCWGLTRLARHELYGMPLLESFGGVIRSSAMSFQRAYRRQVEAALEVCQPFPGAIAAAMDGDACVHIALVVSREGRLQVLEINPGSGARILRLQDFMENFSRVIFYRDRILREQA